MKDGQLNTAGLHESKPGLKVTSVLLANGVKHSAFLTNLILYFGSLFNSASRPSYAVSETKLQKA